MASDHPRRHPIGAHALAGCEQQAGGHEQDRRRPNHQRDQDVGGEAEAAAGVPERHLVALVVVAFGANSTYPGERCPAGHRRRLR